MILISKINFFITKKFSDATSHEEAAALAPRSSSPDDEDVLQSEDKVAQPQLLSSEDEGMYMMPLQQQQL